MKIVIISSTPFNTITYENVSNLAYTNGNYVLTVGATTYTYASNVYSIMVLK